MAIRKKQQFNGDYFGWAGLVYFIVALEVLSGVLPSKGSADPAKSYSGSPAFFWILIGVETAGCLYLLARGVYVRHAIRKSFDSPVEQGLLFTRRMGNILTSVFVIIVGFLFLVLPAVELFRGVAWGGFIFHTHQFAVDPEIFRQIVILQSIIGIVPILGGLLLLRFPPEAAETSI